MKLKQKTLVCALALIPAIGIISYSANAANSAPPKPTVEDCVERFGYTEEKCTEMIENMKGRKPGEGDMKRGGGPGGGFRGDEGNKPPTNGDENSGSSIERELKMAEMMKSKEEERFSRTEERIEKIIDFLQSKELETSEIETDLENFKSKASAISAALDEYIDILEKLKSDSTTELSDEAKEKRESIKTLMGDLRDFYRNTLREDIKEQIDKLTE